MDSADILRIAAAVGGIATGATALCAVIIWMVKRQREAKQRLWIRIERPRKDVFRAILEYSPKSLNLAHFAAIGSLGSNPIYLLPKHHYGLPEDVYDEHIAQLSWPKSSGQWTDSRLTPSSESGVLRAEFRIVPQTTDAAGTLFVRIYTKGRRKKTILRARVPVSLLE